MNPSGRCALALLFVCLGDAQDGAFPSLLPCEAPGSLWVTYGARVVSDPVALREMGKRWEPAFKARQGRQVIWGSEGGAISMGWAWGGVSIWRRRDVQFSGTRDAAEFTWLTKRKRDLPYGRTFDLEASFLGMRRAGLSAWRKVSVDKIPGVVLTCAVGAKVWCGQEGQDGIAHGFGARMAAKRYDADLTVDYHFTSNVLYDMEAQTTKGFGRALTVALQANSPRASFRFVVDDLGNETTWSRIGYSRARLLTEQSHVDGRGYMVWDPSISGIEGTEPWRQRIPVSCFADGWLRGLRWSVGLQAFRFGDLQVGELCVNRHLGADTAVGVGLEGRSRAVSLLVRWGSGSVRLVSQPVSLPRTRDLGIRVTYVMKKPSR